MLALPTSIRTRPIVAQASPFVETTTSPRGGSYSCVTQKPIERMRCRRYRRRVHLPRADRLAATAIVLERRLVALDLLRQRRRVIAASLETARAAEVAQDGFTASLVGTARRDVGPTALRPAMRFGIRRTLGRGVTAGREAGARHCGGGARREPDASPPSPHATTRDAPLIRSVNGEHERGERTDGHRRPRDEPPSLRELSPHV
jgi:hypothetical protein